MTMINGYSIYVGGVQTQGRAWVVRVYRDADDEHIHSAEDCPLEIGLREAQRAITQDMVETMGNGELSNLLADENTPNELADRAGDEWVKRNPNAV